jgi:methionyl-tRNA formyltransferase
MKYNVITGSVFSISVQHKLAHSVRVSTVVTTKPKKREFKKAIFPTPVQYDDVRILKVYAVIKN